MKIILAILNFFQFILASIMITKYGLKENDTLATILIIIILVTPALTFTSFLRKPSGWITLYLERKKLEEKNKIEVLLRNK